jgi:glycosyltransferase involved in cell wall biosynthesis
MRLIVIADTYPPLKMSGAVQMRDLVRELAGQGHFVTVVAPSAGHRRAWSIEQEGRVTLLRVRTMQTKDVGHLRRLVAEILLPFILLRALSASGLRTARWDGIVWYAPTIFLGPVVRRLRRESRCRSYLILRDIFPEWAVDMGLMRRGLAYRFLKWVERRQYAEADTIGVQTEANLPYMRSWAAETGRSLEVLENWLSPAPELPCSIDISQTKLRGRTIFVYTGNMGVAQGMGVFMDMVSRMRDRRDIGFLFVGRGSDAARFALRAECEGLDNVLFHDEIEPNEIPGLLKQCHVAMLALDPRHKSHNIPGKFLTYMQAGIPVLARINPGNDLEELIRGSRVGYVTTSADLVDLVVMAERIVTDQILREGIEERAKSVWRSRFSSESAVKQITRALTGQSRKRRPEHEASRPISVLLLNQYFYPDVAATAQHAFDLAEYLRKHGMSVSAISSRSTYGHAGRSLPRSETIDGIRIHRVGESVFGRDSIASRAMDFLSFNLSCLLKALRLPRHDVVICLTTPPFIALVGVMLAKLKGSRFIFWTMDLYPDVPLAAGIIRHGSLIHRIFDWLDLFCLRNADQVVALGRCMHDRLLAKGVAPARLELITPWSDPEEVHAATGATPDDCAGIHATSSLRSEWGLGNRFIVQYSGNCGIGHDVSSVCDAMLRLKDDDTIRWLFVGGGVARPTVEEFIDRHGIGNAVMKPYQPRSKLGQLISLGDAHLVLVADGFSGLLLPSKFYGVMAAARPTVYVGPDGTEVAKVIKEHECGLVVPNGDGRSLVDAIQRLQRQPALGRAMGLRARDALEQEFSMQHSCQRWLRLIERLARVSPPLGESRESGVRLRP